MQKKQHNHIIHKKKGSILFVMSIRVVSFVFCVNLITSNIAYASSQASSTSSTSQDSSTPTTAAAATTPTSAIIEIPLPDPTVEQLQESVLELKRRVDEHDQAIAQNENKLLKVNDLMTKMSSDLEMIKSNTATLAAASAPQKKSKQKKKITSKQNVPPPPPISEDSYEGSEYYKGNQDYEDSSFEDMPRTARSPYRSPKRSYSGGDEEYVRHSQFPYYEQNRNMHFQPRYVYAMPSISSPASNGSYYGAPPVYVEQAPASSLSPQSIPLGSQLVIASPQSNSFQAGGVGPVIMTSQLLPTNIPATNPGTHNTFFAAPMPQGQPVMITPPAALPSSGNIAYPNNATTGSIAQAPVAIPSYNSSAVSPGNMAMSSVPVATGANNTSGALTASSTNTSPISQETLSPAQVAANFAAIGAVPPSSAASSSESATVTPPASSSTNTVSTSDTTSATSQTATNSTQPSSTTNAIASLVTALTAPSNTTQNNSESNAGQNTNTPANATANAVSNLVNGLFQG